MADSTLVLNDALCFLTNKFATLSTKVLKTVITDFYDVDTLADAKARLMNDVNCLNLRQQLPHIPQRRGGDGRLAHEVNDIVTVLTFVDENKIAGQLPKYVASSPDKMPSLRLFEGDLQVLMAIMQKLSDKVDSFGSALAAITSDVQAIQVWPSLPEPSRPLSITGHSSTQVAQPRLHKQQSVLDQASSGTYNHGDRESTTVTVVPGPTSRSADVGAPAMDWASQAASTPYVHANRFAALSTDDGDHGADDDDASYSIQRRRKRQRQQSSQVRTPQQQQQQQQRPAAAQRRPMPSLYGKSTLRSNIVAAKTLRQKAVFCVDNLSTGCSRENLCDFVANLSVNVISCFETKPRRRRNEEPASDRKAYRLCIYKDDVGKLLNPAAWPHSIVISEWFHKASSTRSDNARRPASAVGHDQAGSSSSRDVAASDAATDGGGNARADEARSIRCTTDDITQDSHSHRPAAGNDDDQLESAITDDEHTIMMTDHSIYGDDAVATLDVPASQE